MIGHWSQELTWQSTVAIASRPLPRLAPMGPARTPGGAECERTTSCRHLTTPRPWPACRRASTEEDERLGRRATLRRYEVDRMNERYDPSRGPEHDLPDQQSLPRNPALQNDDFYGQDASRVHGYPGHDQSAADCPLNNGTYSDLHAQQRPSYKQAFMSHSSAEPDAQGEHFQSDHPHYRLEEDSGEVVSPEEVSKSSANNVAPVVSETRSSSLLKSSAVMAAGTMVSRVTGFIRSALIVAALGSYTLGDTFQIAYQLPTMIYILTVGGGLNSVFVPQLVRAMKEEEDGGEAYANRLLTLVIVALGSLTLIAIFAAPLLVRFLSVETSNNPAANHVAITFIRYCVPTIFFMGIHVVIGQILNARGKFGAMMWTPVLNNIITIAAFGMFIFVYGTSAHSGMTVTSIPVTGERLLGVGILLGLAVQALAMIPYLAETGFRLRFRFDWRGHGLGKSARLAKWTMLFVLANQGGAIIVTQLSTAAGAKSGVGGTGFIAYANAQLIWSLPQAIITVSLMAALLPRLSRAAHDGDNGSVRDDISQGLRTSAVAIVPVAFGFLALGIPICTLIFGSSGTQDSTSMGYMLMAFSLGLIPYSVQYVVLRAFYAYEDTRTPFYNTVVIAVINAGASALCYLLLPSRWAVAGMAASYGIAYTVGVIVAWRRLRKRLGGDLDGRNILRTYVRLALASLPAAALSALAVYVTTHSLGKGLLGSLTALVAGAVVLLGGFLICAKRMRCEELNLVVDMVRGRFGR